MSVFFTLTKIYVYKYKQNQLFQKGATFNFLGKKLRNQVYFPKNLISDQVLGTLDVFSSDSLLHHLPCKIISLNYRTVTLCGHETVRCIEWQRVRSGC